MRARWERWLDWLSELFYDPGEWIDGMFGD